MERTQQGLPLCTLRVRPPRGPPRPASLFVQRKAVGVAPRPLHQRALRRLGSAKNGAAHLDARLKGQVAHDGGVERAVRRGGRGGGGLAVADVQGAAAVGGCAAAGRRQRRLRGSNREPSRCVVSAGSKVTEAARQAKGGPTCHCRPAPSLLCGSSAQLRHASALSRHTLHCLKSPPTRGCAAPGSAAASSTATAMSLLIFMASRAAPVCTRRKGREHEESRA